MNHVELFVGRGCPRCGATAFTAVKPVKGAPVTADRQCKACETRYLTIPALVPGVVRAAMYVSGIVLILGGIMVLVLPFVTAQAPGSPRPTFQVGAIFSFIVHQADRRGVGFIGGIATTVLTRPSVSP